MKTTLYDGSRCVMIDTARDTCLLKGPHAIPQSDDVEVYEKDLYLHQTKTGQAEYYFHIRPAGTKGRDKAIPVPAAMAERYLLQRGITCDDFPTSEPVFRLYNWGYGIAEEF